MIRLERNDAKMVRWMWCNVRPENRISAEELSIWSHLLWKSLVEIFIFCVVLLLK